MTGYGWLASAMFDDGRWADLSCAAKAVLPVLTRFANKDGICWPSTAKIAALAGIHRGHLHRAIKELVEAGLIERVTSRDDGTSGGRGRTTRYRVTAAQARHSGGENCRRGAAVSGPQTAAPAHTKLLHQRAETAAPAHTNSSAGAAGTSSITNPRTSQRTRGTDATTSNQRPRAAPASRRQEVQVEGHDDDGEAARRKIDLPDNAGPERIARVLVAEGVDKARAKKLASHPELTPADVRDAIDVARCNATVNYAGYLAEKIADCIDRADAKAEASRQTARAAKADRMTELDADVQTWTDEQIREAMAGTRAEDWDPELVRTDRASRDEVVKILIHNAWREAASA